MTFDVLNYKEAHLRYRTVLLGFVCFSFNSRIYFFSW